MLKISIFFWNIYITITRHFSFKSMFFLLQISEISFNLIIIDIKYVVMTII